MNDPNKLECLLLLSLISLVVSNVFEQDYKPTPEVSSFQVVQSGKSPNNQTKAVKDYTYQSASYSSGLLIVVWHTNTSLAYKYQSGIQILVWHTNTSLAYNYQSGNTSLAYKYQSGIQILVWHTITTQAYKYQSGIQIQVWHPNTSISYKYQSGIQILVWHTNTCLAYKYLCLLVSNTLAYFTKS